MDQQGAQKSVCSLARILWISQDQDIIQIFSNMKTLTLAKEQYGLSKWSETLGVVVSPNGKIFNW